MNKLTGKTFTVGGFINKEEDESTYLPNKLFVYGIFLDKSRRDAYGMKDPHYATVKDYATFGGGIVKAVRIPGMGLSLTGLIVKPDHTKWNQLDLLESGYDRIIVETTTGELAYMYAHPESEEK